MSTVSLQDYVGGMAARGRRHFRGSGSSWWLQYQPGTMIRLPTHCLERPAADELRRLFWVRLAPLISFLISPTADLPANSTLYLCSDNQYGFRLLNHAAQGNVRRGLREFEVEFITPRQVLEHGAPAFIDTHRKFAPASGTAAEFRRQYALPTSVPGNVFVGAWKDGCLAAFLHLIVVDDWATLSGRYSMTEFLKFRPNEAVLFFALTHLLVERRLRCVDAGVASVCPEVNNQGLHHFKTKMGFQAVPVRRVFLLHPLLRPFGARPVCRLLNASIRRHPSRRLALLQCVLEQTHPAWHNRLTPSPTQGRGA